MNSGKVSLKKVKKFDVINLMMLTLLAIVTVYPFYNVFIISFAKYESFINKQLYILPYSFDLNAYKAIFTDDAFFRGFLVTTFITLIGVVISMILSISGAYALSKKNIPGRNFILGAILFTMFFSGGLIPSYMVVKGLGLMNSIWVMIIPSALNTWNIIIMKNYFTTLSPSLEESAKMDGANDIYIMFKIIIPVSAPIIATFSLFYAVDRWNEWFNALVYISDRNLRPLQIVLREILITFSNQIADQAKLAMKANNKDATLFVQGFQMASVVITVVPILLVYPALQKYFVKGIMIGSIKE